MSDEANPHILQRDLSVEAARPIAEPCCVMLRTAIDYGTQVIMRCHYSAEMGPDEHLAPLYLYRHILELTDGIEVLLAASCPVPAAPLQRSLFEAWVTLTYILRDPLQFSQRSLSWIGVYAIDRLGSYDQLDTSTPAGKILKSQMGMDDYAKNVRFPDQVKTRAAADNMRSLLAKPHLIPITAEYERLRLEEKVRHVRWHQLFGGPRSLRKVAQEVKVGTVYDLLHGKWSKATHATDFSEFLRPGVAGNIKPLRSHGTLADVACVTASELTDATRIMLKHFRPGDDAFPRWYRDVLKPLKDPVCNRAVRDELRARRR